ncbi:MAG: hypothetical protein ACP5RZ_03320 [Thermoplasmata archaeon]
MISRLTDLDKKILLHIFNHGPDSPVFWKRIAPESGMDEVRKSFKRLEELDLIEYCGKFIKGNYETSSVKNNLKIKARPQKGKHSYFCLTRKGKEYVKNLKIS